jgi:hypothetical protein
MNELTIVSLHWRVVLITRSPAPFITVRHVIVISWMRVVSPIIEDCPRCRIRRYRSVLMIEVHASNALTDVLIL